MEAVITLNGQDLGHVVLALVKVVRELEGRLGALEEELSEAKDMLGGYLDGHQQGTGPTTPTDEV